MDDQGSSCPASFTLLKPYAYSADAADQTCERAIAIPDQNNIGTH